MHLVILALIVFAATQARTPVARWRDNSQDQLPAQAAALPVGQGVSAAQLPACAPNDSLMRELTAYAKRAVNGDASLTSSLPLLPSADSLHVYPVQVDGHCRLAAATINRAWKLPENQARTLYLIRAGSVHLVVDTSLGASGRGRSMVMDSALSRMIEF
ncbi:MAG: hypothetical protein ABJC19_11300 [Gemmatimonadota bacterium]